MANIKDIEEMFIKNSIEKDGKSPITVNGNVSAIGNGNTIVHTHKVIEKKEYILTPGEEHITNEQAAKLQELVRNVAEMEQLTKKNPKTIQSIWISLNRYCGVPTYRAIKYTDYEKAIKYLRTWGGRLNSTATARKKDPNWRNKKYASIHAVCRDPEFNEKRLAYMDKKFGTQHLSHLTDEDLEVVCRYVAGLRRKK